MCDGCTRVANCYCPCQDGDMHMDYYGAMFCSQCGCKAEPTGDRITTDFHMLYMA